LIFGLCHAYEGPWGFANALLAGAFLSLIYIKTASFHGVALSHGLYNILVYLYTAASNQRQFF
jgi:membrane protease YdiL (CAAX protease family)